MAIETTTELLKLRVKNAITKNYTNFFGCWVSDPWHSGIPTIYVDVVCSSAGSIRDKFPGLLGDLSVKKLETMAEDLFYAIDAFIRVFPEHTLDLVLSFVDKMIGIQFEDNEICMLFEDSEELPGNL